MNMCILALTIDAVCVQVERENNACDTYVCCYSYLIIVVTIVIDVCVFDCLGLR